MERLDVLVIGAGVVGLATARALALAGRHVIVAEAETTAGTGISSRNSGVIHAGIYYPKNSLKATLCVRGRKLLYDYARERAVPHDNCGKLIVATTAEERAMLTAIQSRAAANGVTDLIFLTEAEATAMEPALSCTAALLSPSTGIIDIHALMQEFIVDIEAQGGIIALQNRVLSGEVMADGFVLQLADSEYIHANTVVNAAGLAAPHLARRLKGLDTACVPAQYLAKGNYFGVSGPTPFQRLIYPVPVPGGLGTHFTRNMAGDSLFGPDVEWLSEGVAPDYTVNTDRASNFRDAIRNYWPGIDQRELSPAYAGVRPKLKPQGAGDSDFVIQGERDHGIRGLINLYGIESPGLTACMAIGEAITSLLK